MYNIVVETLVTLSEGLDTLLSHCRGQHDRETTKWNYCSFQNVFAMVFRQ